MDGNLNEDLNENLAWLTQKTEDPKSNKGNLTFPPHTVNMIKLNCKVIENGNPPPLPHFYINPPPHFKVYPSFLAKKLYPPPSDSIFGRSYPPPLIRGWFQL